MTEPHPALHEDEIHVWTARLDLPASAIERLSRALSDDERERAARQQSARERDRIVAARGLLRRLLARYLAADPAGLRFGYGASGKPYVRVGAEDRPVAFNLSHAGGLALFAFARDAEVGVDLERERPVAGADAIARRVFPPMELESWQALPEGERPGAFLAYWTRIEARLKAYGRGVWQAGALEADPALRIRELETPPGYVGALAVLGTGREPLLRELTLDAPEA